MAKNDLTVKILGDARKFVKALETAGISLSEFQTKAVLAGAVVGGGIVAGAAGLVVLGDKFDSAYDRIQIATGATGDQLKGLQDSFDTVLASGPSSFDDVATAVSGLKQRLGLTGKPLEDLSTQMLDLSRITGTDVTANIETMSQVMNKWNIPAGDMGTSMDELFRASQVTGIGIDDLGTQMNKFGAPLQELGFSFDESAALLGGFEQNGINTTQAMTGMRHALGDLRKPGETGRQTLERLTDGIQNAGTDADATALAIQLFGQKAGPEMAAAIRDGKFDLDEYMGTIEDGQSTIENTAASTDDWREKWNTLKNQVFVKLKPLAMKFFDAITVGMSWITNHQGVLVGALIAIGAVAVFIFGAWAAGAIAAAAATLLAMAPVILIGAALVALAAGLVYAYTHWKVFRDVVDAVGRFFRDTVWPILQAVFKAIVDGAVAVVTWFQNHWGEISDKVDAVVRLVKDYVGGLVDFYTGIFDAIKLLITGKWGAAWDAFKGAVKSGVDAVVGFFGGLWGLIEPKLRDAGGWLVDKGAELLGGLKDGAVSFWEDTLLPWIQGLPGLVVDGIGSLLKTLRAKGRALVGGLKNGIESFWNDTAKPFIKGLPDKAVSAIGAVLSTLRAKGRALIGGLKDGVVSFWNDTAEPWIKTIPSLALHAIGDVITYLSTKGRQLIGGLKTGVVGFWDDILQPWIKTIPSLALHAIGDVFTYLSTKGRQLIGGLKTGIVGFWNDTLKPWISGIPGKIYAAIPNPWTALSGLGHALASGLKSAFQTVLNGLIDVYNNTVARLPGVDNIAHVGGASGGGGTHAGATRGNEYAQGGWVGGRSGQAIPGNTLHGGEYVMSRAELAGNLRGDSPLRGGGGVTNVTINQAAGVTARDTKAATRRYTRLQAA